MKGDEQIGVQLLSTSIRMIFVTQRSYKKGEKWSWYALLMAGIVTWGSLLGYKVLIGYFKLSSSSMTFIVGAILLVIGLALPAKAILGGKEQTE
jgi:xanthine/uracil permease